MSINTTALTGTIVRQDCELRTTASGTGIARFTLCWQRYMKDADPVPGYIDCVLFGDRAKALADHLKRGTKVAVQGELRYSTWEAKDGTKRSKIELGVRELEFMSRKSDAADAGYETPLAEEDIPF